jgi:PadR family transcriptional regulator, regulatory protein PadR
VHKQLDLPLIRKAVSLAPLHGNGVLLRIQQISKDRLEIQQGSLYPALTDSSTRVASPANGASWKNNREAKYCRLTAARGRKLQ